MNIQDRSLRVDHGGEQPLDMVMTVFEADIPSGAGILFIGGYNGIRQRYMRYAVDLVNSFAATCVTVDLTGHGESEGSLRSLNLQNHKADALAAYDSLVKQASVDPARIGIMGASYGVKPALFLVEQRDPKSLLLRAPMVHDELEGFEGEVPSPEARAHFLESLSDISPLLPLVDFQGGVTVVQSEHDEVVKQANINAVLAAAQHPRHVVLPGSAHSLRNEERPAFQEILSTWVAEL